MPGTVPHFAGVSRAHSFQDNTVSQNETDTTTPRAKLMPPKKATTSLLYSLTVLVLAGNAWGSTIPPPACDWRNHKSLPLVSNHCAVIRHSTS